MLRTDPEFLSKRAELEAKIVEAEKPVQVLKDELHALFKQATNFEDGLVYAATTRCKCGAGLAYFENQDRSPQGTGKAWVCSKALIAFAADQTWTDPNGVKHDLYPFMEFSIKSENQPSANGRTTRP